MKPKTLAMRKMQKNFIAVQKKGYPQKPYEYSSLRFLFNRLYAEIEELGKALALMDYEGALNECADCSNFLDYLYERIDDIQRHKILADAELETALKIARRLKK